MIEFILALISLFSLDPQNPSPKPQRPGTSTDGGKPSPTTPTFD